MGFKIRSLVYALATYTTYTTYNYVIAQRIIDQRENEFENTGNDNRFNTLKIHGRFENPFKEYRPQTLYEFFIMRLFELTEVNVPGTSRGGVPHNKELIIKETGWNFLNLELWIKMKEKCLKNGWLSYTWLGQSCGLLQSSNKTFLMDPLIEDYIVNKFIGPKRILSCPINLNDLINIIKPEYILISHDHPDHMGDESIKKLSKLINCKWFVPIGISEFLINNGILKENIFEMKWWDKIKIDNEFEIVCLPAMHWSGRMLYDSNKTLWCSFIILKNGKSLFYHGGDTGYANEIFKKIGEIYGPIKFSALPIGQYCPEWHQKPRHISPFESIKIMNEMKIHKMVGVHWGTFVLSSENYLEPGKLLYDEAIKNNKLNNIIIPNQGKMIIMDENKIDFIKDDEILEDNKEYIIYR
jgi:L-ascorbate metabolism protein UlaG (beta-lactamase superfamily)